MARYGRVALNTHFFGLSTFVTLIPRDIKAVMNTLNLPEDSNNCNVVDLSVAKTNMTHVYNNQWKHTVENTPKLRTYKLFKESFKTEQYVNINMSKHERSMMAQFRCGILPLRIETGRYIGEAVDNRLCRMCAENCIEDEMHFLLSCSKYNHIRYGLFHNLLNDVNFITLTQNHIVCAYQENGKVFGKSLSLSHEFNV